MTNSTKNVPCVDRIEVLNFLLRDFKKYFLVIFVTKFLKMPNLHFELLEIDIFYCFSSIVQYSENAFIFYKDFISENLTKLIYFEQFLRKVKSSDCSLAWFAFSLIFTVL